MAVNLNDPKLFATSAFWPVLAHLRRTDPVYWHPDSDGTGFWVVSRYRHVVDVYTDTQTFASRYGMRLGSDRDAVSAVAQRMLIVSDAPDHTELKRVLGKAFGPAELPRLEPLVRTVVHSIVSAAVEAEDVDFVDVARHIPNHVVCSFMDLPRDDWAWIGQITTEAFEGPDEQTRAAAHSEIFLYFTELLAERRKRPGTDFISRISHARRGNAVPGQDRPLSDEEVVFNCNGILAGANETTRYSAAGGVLAFAENPDQWGWLRVAGPTGIPTAVEEVLRWTTPGVHALRTAMSPTQLSGVHIAVGDRVTVWNVSANRDEDVFTDADRFLAGRSPNRHLTFGAGPHLCLGARLARLELTALFTELVDRVESFELVGEPAYTPSNFTWGLTSLPVRLVPHAAASKPRN